MTATGSATTIARHASTGPRRLSYPQERMFLLDQIMPGLAAYNVPTLWRVGATLDAEKLRQAFDIVVARHEILRTATLLIDGEPMQEVAEHRPFELAVADLRSTPQLDREAEAQRIVGELARRRFDLSRDVLLRACLLHIASGEDLLLVVSHHMASDHASGGLLITELDEAYRACLERRDPELPELPIQYADFAHWQRERLDEELVDELLAYWTKQLKGAPERLDLPSDRPLPGVQSYRGARHEVEIAAKAVMPLRVLARREKTSLFIVLLSAFKALLHRYTGAEDLVVGTPVSGRHHQETLPLLGFFSNTLALRTDLSEDPTFVELLSRVKVTMLGALANQELPFEKLVEVLAPDRTRGRTPIFQVLFGYNVVSSRDRMLAGAPVTQLAISGWESAPFDISMAVHDLPDGSLRVNVGYSTDLFDAGTIERLVGHLQTLLDAAGSQPEQRVSRLPLLSESERRLLLEHWNATSVPSDRRCLHELLAEQAARRPDAIAVISEAEQITYGDLDRRANQLARELVAVGVQLGDLVAICMERSAELVVALLGVLKAGAAYVPIDPSYPPQRQELMLADAEAAVLITEERLLGVIDPRGAKVLCFDRDRDRIAVHPDDSLAIGADSDELAYVIYTSGSTGRPKGVEIQHRALVNLLTSMRKRPGLAPDDVLLAVTTLSFDIAGLELYLPLIVGARVVIASSGTAANPEALSLLIERSAATVMQATPTTWRMLLDNGWPGKRGLKVLCGGEALAPSLADELLEGAVELWNMYGPTETTIWSTVQPVEGKGERLSIGRPIANTTLHVLDRHGQPTPVGVPGELHIGGAGLARGYRNRPELTAERFIADPFDSDPDARLYKTGDLARYRPDGTVEFLGRLDHQVKLRGHRVELGEIEVVLASHPSVTAAVAAVHDIGPEDRRLVAYVVPGASEPDLDELRRLLKSKLPPIMVPSALVTLSSLPVNANGKLDRAALPLPDGARVQAARRYAPPETPVQEALASIWSEVLAMTEVGIDDDFFELGGHSLLAVKMLSRVRDSFGVELYLGGLFDRPTIRELSDEVMLELLGDATEDEVAGMLSD